MRTLPNIDFGDFEAMPAVRSKAVGALANGELKFAYPEVFDVIHLCNESHIAVLGLDLLKVRADGLYATEKIIDISRRMNQSPSTQQEWLQYVKASNAEAEQFVKQNPAGAGHFYLLTTSSWRELELIHKFQQEKVNR